MQKTIINLKTHPGLIHKILFRRKTITRLLALILLSAQGLYSQTATFLYTGTSQTFVVPCGVTSISVDVRGAQGGGTTGANGGLGGRAQSVMTVTPGETLNVYVGGAGMYVTTTSLGGYNGGGGTTYNGGAAGTGGGGSDIRRGTSLVNRIVVAGGGGGGAASGGQNRIGGNGGGLTGSDGLAWNTYTNSGGKGGTQTAGGAAGIACCYTALSGSLGLGGEGKGDGAGGGGGGGGYYGGGGSVFGAGGGGSSFFDNSNTFTTTTAGYQTGDGFVSISYSVSPITVGPVSGPSVICQGVTASYSINSITSATNYSWTVPAGAVINSGQGTNTISVTFSATAGNVDVSPSYPTTCTLSTSSLSVSVSPYPVITVNSGSICSGQSFTIAPSGASTYTIQGGNMVVSPGANASYTVVGTNTAGCMSQSFVTSTVTVNATPTISVNSGSVCAGQSFTIVPSGAATYTFQGGNAVVSPTANASYTVAGTNTAGCVSSSFVTSSITVSALPSVSVFASANTICVGQSATLTASGANTYSWNNGASSAAIVASPTVNTLYTVSGTSSVTGCSKNVNFNLSVIPCTGIAEQGSLQGLSIFPNPTTGNFTIELNNSSIKTIEVCDYTGKVVLSSITNSGKADINLSSFENGIYIVRILNGYDTKVLKVVKQ